MLGELVQGLITFGETTIDNDDAEEIIVKTAAAVAIGAAGALIYGGYKILTDEKAANNASKLLNHEKKG